MTCPNDEPSAEAWELLHSIIGECGLAGSCLGPPCRCASDIDRFRAAGMQEWHPIETAPKGKIVLLWAVTDRADNGAVTNWKVGTGHTPFAGPVEWTWDGYRLREWDMKPTHWMPLPEAPQ